MIKINDKTVSSVYSGEKVIEKIYKGTLLVYGGWKKLLASGVPPLTLTKCKGVDLIDYKIYGESVQDGTPTPETPIEVESVGEKTSNLFDVNSGFSENYQYNATRIENGNIIIPYSGQNNFSAEFNQYIEVVENEQYTYNFKLLQGSSRIVFRMYDKDKNNVGDISLSNPDFFYLAYYGGYFTYLTQATITIPNGVKYIRIGTVAMNNANVEDNIYSEFQFVKGTTVTEYEPYGYRIPVKVRGKNLFNMPDTPIFDEYFYTTIDEDVLKVANELPRNEILYSNYHIEQAEIGTGGGGNYRQISFFDVNGTQLGRLRNSGGYIEEGEISHIRIYAYDSNYQDGQKITNIMVTRTPEDISSYEPYVEPITTNIYLNEPLRKIGDYADYIDFENKRIVRQINKVNLGDYSWILEAGQTPYYYMINLSPLPISSETNLSKSNVLGAKYIGGENNNIGINAYKSGIVRVRPDLSVYDTVEKWQEYAKNNMCYLMYPISDKVETIELPNIPTHKGTNIIEVDTKIQPSNMEVVYKGKR